MSPGIFGLGVRGSSASTGTCEANGYFSSDRGRWWGWGGVLCRVSFDLADIQDALRIHGKG
eukprot:scaffold1911_cov397-Prasinococcus_capsulatus_cf.AAC.1